MSQPIENRLPKDEGVDPVTESAGVVVRAQRDFESRLLRYAQQWVGCRERAREVVQETFLQLHRQLPPPSSEFLAAWLYKVCRHRAIDVRRKESRVTSIANPERSEQRDGAPGPAEVLMEAESVQRVLRLVEDLPERQQEVLRLRFQGDLSYQQIAEVTGMTVNHVGVTLHTAIGKIRQRMAECDRPHSNSGVPSHDRSR